MKVIGIDKNYGQDAKYGGLLGAAYVGLNKLSASFALGLPQLAFSLDSVSKWIVIVGLAPVAEEALFRGILMRYFQSVTKNFWFANIIQAAIFSIFHLAAYGVGMQTAFVGAFLFGIVMGVVAEKTNSLLPSMIAHAIFNGYLLASAMVVVGGI